MKKIKNISKLVIAALVLIACNAEEPGELNASLHDPDVVVPDVTAGTLTAKVDGTDQIATFVTANYGQSYNAALDAMVPDLNVLIIEATIAGGAISLTLPSNTSVSGVSPYVLSAASTPYSGMYNTSITDLSTSTVHSSLQMEFDGQIWNSNMQDFTVLLGSGVATLHGTKNSTNLQGTTITETLNIDLDTDLSGSHVFGPFTAPLVGENTVSYMESGFTGDIWSADQLVTNGSITLNLDPINKLASGTFNFDGIRTNVLQTPLNYGTIDTDGDGVLDLYEQLVLFTDDNDANSPIQIEGYSGYNAANAIWMAADGDGDGITNIEEIEGPDGNIVTTADNTDPYEGNLDTDGDGVSDGQEAASVPATDENDPCDPAQSESYTAYDSLNTVWGAADCDGDGLTNLQELQGLDGDVATTGDTTNPYFVEVTLKAFTNGNFTNVTYNDGSPAIVRGLKIITHDTTAKTISGIFSFISNSIGETPVRSYVISEGTFNVSYAPQ